LLKKVNRIGNANFAALLALLLVIIKLLIYDYYEYFTLKTIPNHDLSQSAGFFATNIHSMILSGEPAYWGPATSSGFAQYFQSFLSGIVPTTNNVFFVIWAQIMMILAKTGVHIPEYFQYLTVNTILLPFLTYFFFALFSLSVFNRRPVTVFLGVVYAFSNTGLWNSAWFLYQEPATVWLVLFSLVNFFKNTGLKAFSLLCIAAVIQFMSLNYWTVFYSWFYVIITGSFAFTHPDEVSACFSKTKQMYKNNRLLLTAMCLLTVFLPLIWICLDFSIIREQSGNYIRIAADNGNYTLWQVRNVILEIRKITTELFNPNLELAVKYYPVQNQMHNARYLGIFMIPLLFLSLFYRWISREKWFFLTIIMIFPICISSPFAFGLWAITPFMDRLRQALYFYSYFWDIGIILFSGSVLSEIINNGKQYSVNFRKPLLLYIFAIFLLLTFLLVNSQKFPASDETMEALSYGGLVALLSAICLLKIVKNESPRFFLSVFLFIVPIDLTKYYFEVNRIDRTFTEGYLPRTKMSEDVKNSLRQSWKPPETGSFGGNIISNMPIYNHLWPDNTYYMVHRSLAEFRRAPDWFRNLPFNVKPFSFYTRAVSAGPDSYFSAISGYENQLRRGEILLINANIITGFTENRPEKNLFSFNWMSWGYNTNKIRITVPNDGYLYINQVHDPLWYFTLDGTPIRSFRANIIGTAIRVQRGEHLLIMDYRPLIRKFFWPAVMLTEGILIFFFYLTVKFKDRRNN
jgi:hypothetical protein